MPGLEPGHDGLYRAAQADFNVRGWQGRLRYTALTALFFSGFVSCGRIARPPTLLTRYRPHPRRLVICVPQRLPAECGSEIPSCGAAFFPRFGSKRSLEIEDFSVALVRTLSPKLSRAGLLHG